MNSEARKRRPSLPEPEPDTVKKKSRPNQGGHSSEPSEDLKAKARSLLQGKGISDGIPLELCCPITMALMMDPATADDGFMYEREAI